MPREQRRQAAALAGPEWLGHADRARRPSCSATSTPRPRSIVYRTLSREALRRAAAGTRTAGPTPTFPSAFPVLRIDHVFVTGDVRGARMHAPDEPLTRLASDHLPLVMDFAL